jgi:hypothetical protein
MKLSAPRVALGSFVVAIAAIACEPRVEEPVRPEVRAAPPAPSASPSPVVTAASAATSAEPAEAPRAARCVKPTPKAPARTLARGGAADPRCPKDPQKPPKLGSGKVTFEGAKGAVTVEIAREDEHRQRGLMYRTKMADEAGMIFVFEERTNHTFWMHNTCIPLDMLFIDRDGTIVGIEENVPTMDDSTFEVGCPSTYVLEVNAGWTRRHGVEAGQSVKIEL